MKETKRRHRFFDAWSSRVCTLSAPGSSPRNARRADVSRTKDLSAAIFLLPVSPALLQQLANQSTVVFGPIESCFRISDGMDTCPRFESFVRISLKLHDKRPIYKT